jgi:hypothetical protein
MAHGMYVWISEMDYTLFDGFLKPLNTDCLTLSSKFDQADGQFLLESHLLTLCDTINLALQLTQRMVHISGNVGGGFSPSIQLKNLNIHTLICSRAYHSINLSFRHSLHLCNVFCECAFGTGHLCLTSCNSSCSSCRNNLLKYLHLTGDV